jgi:TonB-linked SusC/RagA family outer membrane protein
MKTEQLFKKHVNFFQDDTALPPLTKGVAFRPGEFLAQAATKQILKVMQLTAILLLSLGITASAAGNAQTVSLSLKNATLEQAFKQIKKQTGYTFLYTDEMLLGAKPVSIEVKNGLLQDVLDQCFHNQPVSYTIIDKTIVIKKKSPNDIEGHSGQGVIPGPDPESFPPIDITGKVTDSDGNPLPGATVKVKGSSKGTTTNNDGVFVLKGVDDNAMLEISFVGYETYTVAVNNKATLVASLKIKPESLNEVVINKGYYTERQRLSVGNVGKVTSKDIEKQSVTNPLLALQGRVPGLFISQANGLPGSAIKVSLQGQNSILSGNDPLYIIDGVPYTSQFLRTTTGGPLGSSGVFSNGTALAGNPLNYINPKDIESIEILKDADATSIYGSRAANGAILITTKKGKSGDTKFSINMQQGWGKVTRMADLLNTQQYLQMRHEAFANDNATPDPTIDYDLTLWDTTRYTDWQKTLIGNTARFTDINATVSGGSNTLQYLVGGTYHHETTIFPGSFSDRRGAFHFNLSSISKNQKLGMQLTSNYLVDLNKLPKTDLTTVALQLVPDAPALHNSDGSLNWMPNSSGNSSWYNPLAALYNTYQNKSNNLISSLIIGYKVLKNLEVKSSFGYNNLQSNEFIPTPLIYYKPEQWSTRTRSALYSNSNITSWIIEPQANYTQHIGESNLNFLVGTTIQQNHNNGQLLSGSGYNSDQVLENILSATSVVPARSDISVYKYNALFGRIGYNLNERYLLNITARRDGSSRFGSENQFHNFWSLGAGWIFSQEKFFSNNFSFVSFGKIRGSYGTTGNDQIGEYKYLNLYNPLVVASPYQNASSLTPRGLSNPYLQWEETKKLQLGLDLSLFRDRVSLTTNYIRNRSSNQLLGYSLPIITGFFTVSKNFPATVQNSAWEFSFNSVNIKSTQLNWSSSINLTIPKNKLVAFSNLSTSSYANSLVIGKPITIQKVFHFVGVNDTTGIYQFADSKGNPTYSPSFGTDDYVVIDKSPKYYGGIQNSFSYKGIELTFLFQFVKQIGINYRYTFIPGLFDDFSSTYNQPVTVLDRWQKIGDKAKIARFSYDYQYFDNYNYTSDANFSDASFIRLKNLSLAWQLPKHWISKAPLENCELYVQGQNLWTITNYKGMDPENQGTNSQSSPPLKVFTVGVHVIL